MLRINEVLNDKGGNYILPFLWLHGEAHEILRDEIDKIEACTIKAFCVESRPHPDFLGPSWWSDMDFIMEEARRRHMRVWLLDDDTFPTGHANGAFLKQPDKKKLYLAKRQMDLIGPSSKASVLIENFLGSDGCLLAVYVCKRVDKVSLELNLSEAMDVTGNVKNGVVYFDIPEGFHRLIVLYTTRKNGGREDYMNLIDEASVQVLIDTVYEAHYERYKEDFGKTFAGFFSDEPELGNVAGYGFDNGIGKKEMHLPWSEQLHTGLKALWNDDTYKNLIGLWYDVGERTKSIRNTYMDQVTFLVEHCFSDKIGTWCAAHKVQYIGHVIEDDNAHTRLGCSVGHYFRAQKGQHIAGIDVVHLQLLPGFKEKYHQWIAGETDGEFFHFGLAKLAFSSARLDLKKKGRAMCEIFGSYGWAESAGLMKWLTDHMLLRGINHFVPHAFSPKFPDRDCPPHFYARGNNPQYPYVSEVMAHMNRMSHILNGGHMDAAIGVLYHAEAEWSGGEYEPYQKILRVLAEHQMDATVISSEYLAEGNVDFNDNVFKINQLPYKVLVIPTCEYLSDRIVFFIQHALMYEIPIIMCGKYPKSTVGGQELCESWIEKIQVLPVQDIPMFIKERTTTEIEVLSRQEDLRTCCYHQNDGVIFLFLNEHPFKSISTQVLLHAYKDQNLFRYDSMNNRVEKAAYKNGHLLLKLSPGEFVCYFIDKVQSATQDADDWKSELSCYVCENEVMPDEAWNISLLETGIDNTFRQIMTIPPSEELPSINGLDAYTSFSGIIRYESQFEFNPDRFVNRSSYKKSDDQRIIMELSGVSDAATLYINRIKVGNVISAPYDIDITSVIHNGQNEVAIEVANTLTWRVHDGQSTHTQMNPTGMLKRPSIKIYRLDGGKKY